MCHRKKSQKRLLMEIRARLASPRSRASFVIEQTLMNSSFVEGDIGDQLVDRCDVIEGVCRCRLLYTYKSEELGKDITYD